MVALNRDHLSTRSGSSVFYHVLETEDRSAEEEVQERNFRDLMYVMLPASIYVHILFCLGYSATSDVDRFLLLNHMWFLPEAGNMEEEMMLGVLPPASYVQPDVQHFTDDELVRGEHLFISFEYFTNQHLPLSSDEQFFYTFTHSLQNTQEPDPEDSD